MANTTGDLALIIPALTDTVQTTIETHLPSNFEDIDIAVSAKINTAQIANNLTETVAGKVLDATQGKIINDDLVAHTAKDVSDVNGVHGIKTKTINASSLFANGWGAPDFPLYFKRIGNMVFVNGWIKNGVVAINTVILQLTDADFIPSRTTSLEVFQFVNPLIARNILVLSDGAIKVDNNYAWVAGTYKLNFFYEV